MLDVDPFDADSRLYLKDDVLNNELHKGDIIIWENWFSVVDWGVSKAAIDNTLMLVKLYETKANDNGREIHYVVYERE